MKALMMVYDFPDRYKKELEEGEILCQYILWHGKDQICDEKIRPLKTMLPILEKEEIDQECGMCWGYLTGWNAAVIILEEDDPHKRGERLLKNYKRTTNEMKRRLK